MKPTLIVIAGPTACGKTELSIELAARINGEIISADSMQIYKLMDIGTAKVSKEEMRGIKHYLIDELYPDEEYSVVTFQRMAKDYLAEIYEKGKIPILVGGTGFYINALVNNNDFTETETDLAFRQEMYELAEKRGNGFLYERLKAIDPKACETIHENNVKRVIRALEYHKQTGEQISLHNFNERQKESFYNTLFFVLNMDRDKLYKRIELRVDNMLERGLVYEVENLLKLGYSPELTSMQGLGYKEIVPYIQGNISLLEAIDILKRDTRHFAKRQITWFKHQSRGNWINIDETVKEGIIVESIENFIGGNIND